MNTEHNSSHQSAIVSSQTADRFKPKPSNRKTSAQQAATFETAVSYGPAATLFRSSLTKRKPGSIICQY